jgi:tetratricopeptide (TPR) repeat protein
MALSRSRINFIFACVVALLGLTAVAYVYLSSSKPVSPSPPAQEASGSQLPANHPDIDFASRQKALEQLIAKDPRNPDYRTQLANIFYDHGEYDKAAATYQESLNLRPQDANVETDLATCYYNLGKYDKALETLNSVLKYSPDFSQAKYNKGIVLASGKNDVKGGIAIWEDLLRSDPGFSKNAELEQKLNQLKASVK